MKGQYEQMHLRLAAQLTQDEIEKNRELNQLRTTMEHEQTKYRECFNRLKNMKQEIEHLQHIIEKDRLQILKDFDDWWEQQSEQLVGEIYI
jgi:kinesin family protein 6/9